MHGGGRGRSRFPVVYDKMTDGMSVIGGHRSCTGTETIMLRLLMVWTMAVAAGRLALIGVV